MIEKINSAEDVKKLNIEEQKQLAEEIRKYILEIVSKKWRTFSFKSWSSRINNSLTYNF